MDPNQVLNDPHFLYLLPFMGLFFLVGFLVYVIPFWMIFKKAGFSPWLVLLFFVPLANLIVLYIVAFSQWKVVPISQCVGTAYPPAVYPPQQTGYPAPYPPATPPPANPYDPIIPR
jgi:hypothetical protein